MSPGKNLGVDLGSTGGDWLFRQEGLVLGPVHGTKLVEMLYAGDIDGRTEVAPMGSSSFKRLAETDVFKVHYAKAEAKRRVDLTAAQEHASSAKKRNVKLAAIGGVAVTLAVGAAFAAQYAAVHLSSSGDEPSIQVEPITITVASRHLDTEELVDYPGAGRPRPGQKTIAAKPVSDTVKMATPVAPGKKTSEKTVASAATKAPKMSNASDDPDGMQMAQFDQAAINGVVASRQKSLYPCFIEESKRTPDISERIPLEFVIGNDGRVAKLWVDNPKFKSGPLYDCLLREMQRWPFKPYDGERATVNLSFNIGKKK